ncbi:hypothetical protein LBMAG42_53930 [Deltaproteobacteria bacterium]|nr:hypothetical protein LBMAG42_53930 [Deltaproteobacteria bacterium]
MTEGIVFRQLSALRRRGVSQAGSLALLMTALPEGALRVRVQAARQALEAGAVSTDDVLAMAEPSEAQLECGAMAADAKQDAAAVRRMTRGYLAVGAGIALGLTSIQALIHHDVGRAAAYGPEETGIGLAGVFAMALVSLVVAIAVSAVLWLPISLTPGARYFAAAAEVASGAGDEVGATFMRIRLEQVGDHIARLELVEELLRLGRNEWRVASRLAPMILALALATLCGLVAGLTGWAQHFVPMFGGW